MTARPPPAMCEKCRAHEAILFAATVEVDSTTLTPRGWCVECAKIADPLRRPTVFFCEVCRQRTATSFETKRSKTGALLPECLCRVCHPVEIAKRSSDGFWFCFRVILGLGLLVPLTLLLVVILDLGIRARTFSDGFKFISLLCFFAAQAYAVCRILIFRRSSVGTFAPPPSGDEPGPAGGALVPIGPRVRPPVLSVAADFPEADASAA